MTNPKEYIKQRVGTICFIQYGEDKFLVTKDEVEIVRTSNAREAALHFAGEVDRMILDRLLDQLEAQGFGRYSGRK